jgi:hypothetical protein
MSGNERNNSRRFLQHDDNRRGTADPIFLCIDVRFGLPIQPIAATQSANFSAGE